MKYVIDRDKKVIVIFLESETDIIALSSLPPTIILLTLNFDKYIPTKEGKVIPSLFKHILSFANSFMKFDLSQITNFSNTLMVVKEILSKNEQIMEETSDGWKIVIRKV